MKVIALTRREMLAVMGAFSLAPVKMINTGCDLTGSGYREMVLKKGPVGYWRLGGKSGNTIHDESSFRHDGVVHGNVRFDQEGALRNDRDRCALLEGSRSFMEVPDSEAFSQPTSGNGLTVEAWMRPDVLEFDTGNEPEPYIYWLGKGEPGMYEWALRFYSRKSDRPNRISAYIWNLTGGLGAGAYVEDTLTPGKWMHIVACYSPGDRNDSDAAVSLYKNGVLRGGPSAQPPQAASHYKQYRIQPAHGKAPVRFGTRDKSSFFRGALDEVAIYPRVLSGAEILENYRAGTQSGEDLSIRE